MASEAFSQTKIAYSFFYTRNGRPIPKEQQLTLVSLRKESPFEIVVLIGSAIAVAPAAWIYFRILRGSLLLPGEIEKQNVEIEKGKSEIEKLKLEKVHLAYEIEEKRRRLQAQSPKVVEDVRGDLRELPPSSVESFEERLHLVERDVERLTDHEIVVSEISVRRYVRVKKNE
ncbi:MAG: hypothetical protein ACHP8A_07265 [Terriglobales bacterium]